MAHPCRWRWWWRPAKDTSGEARAQLQRLEGWDAEVAELGEELRERQRANHFSEMVAAALARTRREES